MEVYNVHKIQEGEYTFDTRKNLSYCIELKKSHLSYETIEEEIKYTCMLAIQNNNDSDPGLKKVRLLEGK